MPEPIAQWNSVRDVWETPGTGNLFCEHSDVFSETFPTSGFMRSGEVYALPTWEVATADIESLSSQPEETLLLTPVAAEGTKPSNTMGVARRLATGQVFLTNQVVTLMGLDPSEKLLPTVTSSESTGAGSGPNETGGDNLRTVVQKLLPTPTVGMMMGGSLTRSGVRNGEKLLPGVAKDLIGKSTSPQSADGNLDSAGQLRGQQSLQDALGQNS